MSIQIIHDRNNFFCIRVLGLGYITQTMREVFPGTPLCYRNLPPFGKGIERAKRGVRRVAITIPRDFRRNLKEREGEVRRECRRRPRRE